MKRFYSMKTMLLLAAMFVSGAAFADEETSVNAKGGTASSEAVTGESYTVPGDYIAGGGSTQAGTMPNKGFKLRTGTDGNRAVFNVNKPYTITRMELEGIANYEANEGEEYAYQVTNVEVDGNTITTWSGGKFKGKAAGETGTLIIEDINAAESVAIYFANTAGGNQINMTWTITYGAAEASEPTIFVEPATIRLIPGVEYQLQSKVVPNSFEDVLWYTGEIGEFLMDGVRSEIVDVNETGVVTTLKPGTEEVKLTWLGNPVAIEDTCVVVVTDFVPAEHAVVKTYDFTTMGSSFLEQGGIAGKIWNDANSQTNDAYFCATPGLEDMCFQAVIASDSDTKGWKLVEGEGLNLTGAGRCAGIGGLSAGQYVEIVYTGNTMAYRDRGMGELKNGQDISVVKEVINEEPGRAIFKVLPDDENADLQNNQGVLGFEIDRGAYVRSITVYGEESDPTAIKSVETKNEQSDSVYNLLGIKVANSAKGLLIKNGKKYIVK